MMKKNQLIFITTTFSIVAIVFIFISLYFGFNPINNSIKNRIAIISVFPQGWAFFTRDSRESRLHVFDLQNNGELMNLRNTSLKFGFGASRHNRIQNLQVSNIVRGLNIDSISEYKIKAVLPTDINSKINFDTLIYQNVIIDKEVSPDFQGKYIIAIQLMLPWYLLHKQPNYPSTFILYPVNIIYK